MLYSCRKCGRYKAINIYGLLQEMKACDVTSLYSQGYKSEELVLPAFCFHDNDAKEKHCGVAVAKVLEKYNKMGIDLRAFEKTNCVMFDFDLPANFVDVIPTT